MLRFGVLAVYGVCSEIVELVGQVKHCVAGNSVMPYLGAALCIDGVCGIGQLVQQVEGIGLDSELPFAQ